MIQCNAGDDHMIQCNAGDDHMIQCNAGDDHMIQCSTGDEHMIQHNTGDDHMIQHNAGTDLYTPSYLPLLPRLINCCPYYHTFPHSCLCYPDYNAVVPTPIYSCTSSPTPHLGAAYL